MLPQVERNVAVVREESAFLPSMLRVQFSAFFHPRTFGVYQAACYAPHCGLRRRVLKIYISGAPQEVAHNMPNVPPVEVSGMTCNWFEQ